MARFTSPDANGAPGPAGPVGPIGPQGEIGLTGATGADFGIYYLGNYVSTNGYVTDIAVVRGSDGQLYLAKASGQLGDPINYQTNGQWEVWIPKGADGAQGPQGEQGIQGDPGVSGTTAVLAHQVKAGEALTKGQAVYVSSADGTNMIVSKASNTLESTSSKTMGLITTSLANNGQGTLLTEGLLSGLNTNGANAGDPVWLGTDGNLIYGLANKPSAPAHLVFIGIVTRANANNGEIFVKCQNGFEVRELHDAVIESNGSVTDNEVFAYDSASGMWKNQTAAEANLVTKGAFNYTQVVGTRVAGVNSIGATIISGSITTNGYPVHIIVTGEAENVSANGWATLQLYRGSTAIGNIIAVEGSQASENSAYALQFIDTPSAGTYTYSMKTQNIAGGSFNFGEFNGPTLCIMELGK